MIKNKKITLLIPCFNEEEGIGEILKKIPDAIDEIIVVDNNSTDRTPEIARGLGARVVFEPARGYGRAYLTGFKHCSGDIIVTMDGDGTYPLESIPDLAAHLLENELDFISGSRFPLENPEAMYFLNRLGNRAITFLFCVLMGERIKDSCSGMWVFKKEILESMDLGHAGMPFSHELKMEAIANEKIIFVERPIGYRPRFGETKLRKWRDGFQTIIFLFQKRFRLALKQKNESEKNP